MAFTSYEEYQKKKKDLLDIMHSAAKEVGRLKEEGVGLNANAIEEYANKLERDNFKVLVIGEFKNGKSTFINALLGDKILPAYSTPCTAVINEVVYGKDKCAMLYFKDPLPKNISPDIIPRAAQHIRKYRNKGSIPPYEIDVADLEDYVAIPDPTKDQADSIQELPYSKVVLNYPVELCRNGVEIIDSPGLNENETRTKVTAEYLNKADAILFVFRCPKLCGINEMSYIESDIRPRGHEDIFFICNAINQVPAEDRERLKKFGNKKLAPMTSLGEDGIFYVDALGALEAKRDHDDAKLAGTGIPKLESALSAYLQNDRGKKKLLRVFAPCSSFIDDCIRHSDGYINTLQQGAAEFEKRVDAARPSLEMARKEEELVRIKIDAAMERLPQEMKDRLSKQYDHIIASLTTYVDSLDLENKITLNISKHKAQQEELSNELKDKIGRHIQGLMGRWITNELTPFLDRFISKLETDIEKDIDRFYDKIDTFRFDVSGIENPKEINGWSRVGGSIIGTLVGGPTYGLVGMELGVGEALKRSAVSMGVAAVGGYLLALTPAGLATIMTVAALGALSSGTIQLANAGKDLTNKFKKQITQAFQDKLREDQDKSCQEYVDKLTKDLKAKLVLIPQALHQEVELEESKIKALLAAQQKNEQECKKKIQTMKDIQNNLKSLQEKMDKFQNEIG